MENSFQSTRDDVWVKIEAEKRRDRVIRRICIGAWTVTFTFLLAFMAMVMLQVSKTLELLSLGVVGLEVVVTAVMPLVAVVGTLSLLIAVLSTVGVFLRLRTASLTEIQLRLAALEEILLTGSRPEEGSA